MKKIAVLVASVLVLGGFSPKAFAAETNTQTTQPTETVSYKDEAGITPDSWLYTIDKAVDNLRILLATNDEKLAEVKTSIAEERLGESEVMTEAGKTELAQKALEDYNKTLTEATEKLQAVLNNIGTTDKETTEDSTSDKLEQSITDLQKAIQEVQDKSLVVLDNLKTVVPKESADDVEKVIEDQTAHKEAVAKFVAERHDFNAAKKALNMAKVSLKKVEKSGNEADIKAAQDKLTAAQSAYDQAKTELQAAFQAKKAADAKTEENKDEVKPEETTNNLTEEAAKIEENNKTVTATETAKPVQYTKTNNGNGNKSSKIEEKDDNEDKGEKDKKDKKDKEKSSQGKSREDHGKSGQGNDKEND